MAMLATMIRDIRTARLLFGLSLFVFAFYFIGFLAGDIYKYAVAGAIYELLWLPMLLCLLLVPLFSLIIFIKSKGKHRLYAAFAFLFIVGAYLILSRYRF